MSETICPDCGERNVGRVEFCGACGAFLAWDGPAAAPTAAAPQPSGPAATAVRPVTGSVAPAGTPPARTHPAPGRPAPTVAAAGVARDPMPQSQATEPLSGGASSSPSTRPVPAAPAAPPPDAPCPRCGVPNTPSLRFCRKCGLALRGPTLHDAPSARPPAPAERTTWWRRLFGSGDGTTRRAARAAYRHSLPLRYRLLRWVMALAAVAAVVGLLAVLGRNPVGWVTDRIQDLRGSLVQVSGLTAYGEPAASVTLQPGTTTPGGAGASTDPVPVGSAPGASGQPAAGAPSPSTVGATGDGGGTDGQAQDLLDNRADTAWTTPWTADVRRVAAQATCVSPLTPTGAGAPGSVVLVPPQPVAVRQLTIAAGLAKDDSRRVQQWRPKTIQLAYGDGRCQQLVLTDVDGLQQIPVDPVESSKIRLSVVDAFPPLSDQPVDELAITDIRLFQRP